MHSHRYTNSISSNSTIHVEVMINLFKGIVMCDKDQDLETAFKVVSIMQTITEELDEKGKRAWRKMLGIKEEQKSD